MKWLAVVSVVVVVSLLGKSSAKDSDECSIDDGGCSENAKCVNSQGSFTCICLNGFIGDGTTCQEQCNERTQSVIHGRQGFYLRYHALENLTAYSEEVCHIKCFLTDLCESYNYNAITHRCELNDADQSQHESHLVQKDDFIFVSVKDYKIHKGSYNCRSCVFTRGQ